MIYVSYVFYSIQAYIELKVVQGNSTLTLHILLSENLDPWRGITYC